GETIRLSAAQAKLEGLMVQKKSSLTVQRRELNTVRSAAARITKNVANLNQLIASLDQAVERSTGLGAYNRAIEAAPATRDTEPKPGASEKPLSAPTVPTAPAAPPKTTKVVAALPKTIVQPRVSLTPGVRGSLERADRLAPAIPFHRAKGRLPLPAAGRLVLNYGDRTRYGRRSKGVVIETRNRAQITSPADGWVVYAGPFRSYGQLLIINTGGGYHIILAGLSRIDVQLGQFVLASEPIGAMGRGAGKQAARTKPVLYVEFRRKGQPIDPKPWWVRGRVVAQR
ncbi:MAG: peptidoglycan DD-metalloendopeptidase family protein, partial [Pseudomonadota bacterium]